MIIVHTFLFGKRSRKSQCFRAEGALTVNCQITSSRKSGVTLDIYIYFCMALWSQIPANRRGVDFWNIFYLLRMVLKYFRVFIKTMSSACGFLGSSGPDRIHKDFLAPDPLQSEIFRIDSGCFRVFAWAFSCFVWIKLPFPTPRRPHALRGWF